MQTTYKEDYDPDQDPVIQGFKAYFEFHRKIKEQAKLMEELDMISSRKAEIEFILNNRGVI